MTKTADFEEIAHTMRFWGCTESQARAHLDRDADDDDASEGETK